MVADPDADTPGEAPDDLTELWAWIALPVAGGVGDILTMQHPVDGTVPLVSRNEKTMRDVRHLVAHVASRTGATIVLQRFALADVEDVVSPALESRRP